MDRVRKRNEPGYLDQRKQEEDWPPGPPSEPIAGGFLLGAFVLCLDLWLLGVLAVRRLTS